MNWKKLKNELAKLNFKSTAYAFSLMVLTLVLISCKENSKNHNLPEITQNEEVKNDTLINTAAYSRINSENESALLWVKFREAGSDFLFRIEVVNKNCSRELAGNAKIAAMEQAIFSSEDCEELVFQFIYDAEADKEVIQVSEKNCTYQGLGCGFEGENVLT